MGSRNNPPPASAPLVELMARAALRDQAAFKQIYDLTVCCLLGIIVRLVRDRSWAEEILQEVYVSIWHTAANYSPLKAQPMTWLMAIARNKALDALRNARADSRYCVRPLADAGAEDENDLEPPDIVDAGAGPLEQLLQAAEARRLRCCLERLDPQQRQAIALAFYDGLTHPELALHLRQPLGTVKAWVRRGLERLKGCLEPNGHPRTRIA